MEEKLRTLVNYMKDHIGFKHCGSMKFQLNLFNVKDALIGLEYMKYACEMEKANTYPRDLNQCSLIILKVFLDVQLPSSLMILSDTPPIYDVQFPGDSMCALTILSDNPLPTFEHHITLFKSDKRSNEIILLDSSCSKTKAIHRCEKINANIFFDNMRKFLNQHKFDCDLYNIITGNKLLECKNIEYNAYLVCKTYNFDAKKIDNVINMVKMTPSKETDDVYIY